MNAGRALFRQFGQVKSTPYLHLKLPEKRENDIYDWDEREVNRWRRIKEDFKRRGVKVLKTHSALKLLRTVPVKKGRAFIYRLHATWDLAHREKQFQQLWSETRCAVFRYEDHWRLEEDRLLVPEGGGQRLKESAAQKGRAAPGDHEPALSGLYLRLPEELRNYDREKAVAYAQRYWNSYNPQFEHFDVDCTNYVSQCLWAGGAPMAYRQSRAEGWWYRFSSPPQWSFSWSVAHSLRWYLSSGGLRAREVSEASQLQPGDVICYDFEGDGRWDHTTIVVAKDGDDEPLVNAHTTNSRNRYWAYRDSSAWTPSIRYKFFRIMV